MLFNVKNRSPESWGPLAKCNDESFNRLINTRRSETRNVVKEELKRLKKLKTYKVTFTKTWVSDTFELEAESDWDLSAVAREYWKANEGNIGFKEKPRGQWAGEYKGYDSIQYVKVRSSK